MKYITFYEALSTLFITFYFILKARQIISLTTLREMNFVNIKEQGFVPTYKRTKLTDALHDACGFKTDYEFITKSQMRTIQKENFLHPIYA